MDAEILLRSDALRAACAVWFGLCSGGLCTVAFHRAPQAAGGGIPGWLRTLSSPPSRCPCCARNLRAWEILPVLGWIWLRGRCSGCRSPIPSRYPLVEAFVGAGACLSGSLGAGAGSFWIALAAWCLLAPIGAAFLGVRRRLDGHPAGNAS